jgi:hypothetical protein
MSTFPGAFVPVAPPADGLRLAFVAARRRRQRKAGAAGAAGLLAAVALLASAGAGGDRTLLQEPVPPANNPGLGVLPGGGDQSDSPTSAPTTAAAIQAGVQAAPGTDAAPAQNGAAAVTANESATTAGSGSRVHAASTRPISGPMERSTSIGYSNDLVCPARKQQERQRVLCTDVYASNSGKGTMTVRAEICNAGTATELLSFATARELDVIVRRAGVEVWRWSLGRHFAATPHDMTIGTQQCVTWTTDWAQVDAHGVPVKAGDYEIVADLDADEIAGPDRHPSYPMTVSSQP